MFCLFVSCHLLLVFIVQDMVQQDPTKSDQIENHQTTRYIAQQKRASSKKISDENINTEVNTDLMLKLSLPLFFKCLPAQYRYTDDGITLISFCKHSERLL